MKAWGVLILTIMTFASNHVHKIVINLVYETMLIIDAPGPVPSIITLQRFRLTLAFKRSSYTLSQ